MNTFVAALVAGFLAVTSNAVLAADAPKAAAAPVFWSGMRPSYAELNAA